MTEVENASALLDIDPDNLTLDDVNQAYARKLRELPKKDKRDAMRVLTEAMGVMKAYVQTASDENKSTRLIIENFNDIPLTDEIEADFFQNFTAFVSEFEKKQRAEDVLSSEKLEKFHDNALNFKHLDFVHLLRQYILYTTNFYAPIASRPHFKIWLPGHQASKIIDHFKLVENASAKETAWLKRIQKIEEERVERLYMAPEAVTKSTKKKSGNLIYIFAALAFISVILLWYLLSQ